MADFEYVVVGSGAGGGPLAASLARKGFKVLLLDAGGDSCAADELGRLMYEVPIFHGLSTEYKECRWDYFVRHYADDVQQHKDSKLVTHDPATGRPLAEDGIWYPRAGTLGGCTAHNAMITVTPQDCDWNNIADITGDSSWRAGEMNRYFARLEDCHYVPAPGSLHYILNGMLWSLIALFKGRTDWRDWAHGHGFGGWLSTSEADPLLVLKDSEVIHLLVSATKFALEQHIEHPIVSLLTKLDPNDTRNGIDMREGLAFTPLAVRSGRRNGPRELLLETKKQYPANLTIQLHSLVSKIKFEGNRAIGVEFMEGKHLYESDPTGRQNGSPATNIRPQTVSVSREVILCAGAFNSPQILKLSGVGPKEELKRFDIDVVAHLPGVGRNLQDRYEASIVSEFPKPFLLLEGATFEPPKAGGPEDPCFKLWEQRKGIYCANGALIGVLKRSEKSQPEPDLYIFGLPGFFKGYQPGYSSMFERQRNRFTWVVLKAYTNNPVGTVELQSNSPRKWPRVTFNSFSAGDQDGDLSALVRGLEFAREMNHALGAGAETEILPGPGYSTESKLREWVRNEAWGHHASCSNKIGSEMDPLAVLDSRFRVRGTRGLRVVDASVFPRIPGYFIVSAIYMISEKAADVIPEG